jgi:cysteinyl-tRNA synthetase
MVKLYNSLTRTIEDFKPIHPEKVGMYTCGPTVYSFNHIGNFRTYFLGDLLMRTFKALGYDVDYIMNFTDVGHLTGDNLGDADHGEDKMESAAAKEGKTAWELAEFYIEAFMDDFDKLHMEHPEKFVKATDHIQEQIELIKHLEEKSYTYQTSDGIYFDTAMFPEYGQMSSLDQIKEGARVEINEEKRNPRDFALWKFSPQGDPSTGSGQGKRQMEWDSPWGIGFPGWHIECSAMSMKYLGETFDIHTGGMDLKETHHPNEIAQSEAATGKKFVNYWLHGAFMLVNGEKMSKSKGNVYRLYDLEKDGYTPEALRYLYMQTHYRQEMNFTFGALDAATNALENLRAEMLKLPAGENINQYYKDKFLEAMSDDLNTSAALATMWEMLKSTTSAHEKLPTLFFMDSVFGLQLKEYYETVGKKLSEPIPQEIREMVEERNRMRKDRQYVAADHMRNRIKKLGYDILDEGKLSQIKKLID